MLDIGTILKHYKREDIQKEMIAAAENKEVAVRFSDKGFGKRPDTLVYPNDILELAKQGASSFHCSEELWSNPLSISTGMRKKEIEDIRIGWDLVLDIDCPIWEISKITTYLFIKALEENCIKDISVKFSGNKGFHIGVPFEAFPDKINNVLTKDLFPEAPKKIALYLLDHITKNHIKITKNNSINFSDIYTISIDELKKLTKKTTKELTKKICPECSREIISRKKSDEFQYACEKCGHTITTDINKKFMKCEKCGFPFMKNILQSKKQRCRCGSDSEPYLIFNPLSILEIDTILISSRHLYRMPYSLHEKSGLASLPIEKQKLLSFNKKDAEPKDLKIAKTRFLDKKNIKKYQGLGLFTKAMSFEEEDTDKTQEKREYEEISIKLPESYFPPCIMRILKGITDGRKRSLFILTNFLSSVGWNPEEIKELLLEWNKRNPEPLRDNLIISHINYHKRRKTKVLPPNCANKMYYEDIRTCLKDSFCPKIKNPVNYALRKARIGQKQEKKPGQKLTEEQKEMRKKHREKLKQDKEKTS